MTCKPLGKYTGMTTGCGSGDKIFRCNHPDVHKKCLPEIKVNCNKSMLAGQKDKTILKNKINCQLCPHFEENNEEA